MIYNILLLLFHRANMKIRAHYECQHPTHVPDYYLHHGVDDSHTDLENKYDTLMAIVTCVLNHKEVTCKSLSAHTFLDNVFTFADVGRIDTTKGCSNIVFNPNTNTLK